MIKKSFPIKKPYLYDTKDGIDFFTKELLIDNNSKKLSPKEKQDIHNLGRDMKKSVLNHHIKTLKPFDNLDSSTYPSRPEVRGKLLEIEKLEKDLAPPKLANLPILKNNINKPRSRTGNPSGRDYWREYVDSGGKELPEVSPEDRNQPSATDWWKAIYKGMSPFEKGQWNNEQRRKKLQREKETAEDNASVELTPVKMAREVIEHVLPSSSEVPEQKSDNHYPGAVSVEDSISNMTVDHAIIPKKHEPGLSHNFTREKLAEGKLLKEVLGE